jgi:Ca2+-binding RTX toxin-like protein
LAALGSALVLVASGITAAGAAEPAAWDSAPSVGTVRPDSGTLAALEAALAADGDGQIRAVVTTDLAVAPEAELTTAEVAAQRGDIAEAIAGLAAELDGTASQVLTPFTVVPAAVVILDAAGLARLGASDLVASITLDRAFPLALDVSTGVIDSDLLNTAGVLGNNYEGSTGGAFEVAILDTGVLTTHNAFTGRIVAGACFSRGADDTANGVGDCPNGTESQTGIAAGNACTYSTLCNHGSHVAGIAAGAAHIGGHEGVARGAGIVSVQVGSMFTGASCGSGPDPCWLYFISDLDLALEHVLSLEDDGRNLAAVNLSLGGTLFTTENACDAAFPNTASLVDNLDAAGVAVVAATGNQGSATQVTYPGCLSSSFAVAATDDSDVPADFSNNNAVTDWWAPGVGINAPSNTGQNARVTLSGTSMAAPHVTGAFALLRECVGNDTPAEVAADLATTDTEVTHDGITRPRINVRLAATGNVPNNQFAASRVLPPDDLINDDAFNVCADSQANEPGIGLPQNTVWWSWTPAASGVAAISTDDGGGNVTTFDSELAVFTGGSVGNLTQVAYDNNGGEGERSLVEILVAAGTTYRIRVDGVGAENGLINLHIDRGPAMCDGLVATVVGTNGSDAVVGTGGNDVIYAGMGADTVDGLGGDDVICTGSGDDVVDGGLGDDTIEGGAGSDTVSFADATAPVTAGVDTASATGGGGSDMFTGFENLTGSPHDDVLTGDSAANTLSGGSGEDQLIGGDGEDLVNGDAGVDGLEGGAGDDTLTGGPDGDTLLGGTGGDTLVGGAGNDTLNGNASGDVLRGGVDNDTITGGAGADTLTGGDGSDVLAGGTGVDAIDGGNGADQLSGEAGSDDMEGGTGNDTLTGGDGNDQGDGGNGADLVNGQGGVDVLTGGSGNDTVNGGGENDTLHGNGNADQLNGQAGADDLSGDSGNDALAGGSGSDTCAGGLGVDTATSCESRVGIP